MPPCITLISSPGNINILNMNGYGQSDGLCTRLACACACRAGGRAVAGGAGLRAEQPMGTAAGAKIGRACTRRAMGRPRRRSGRRSRWRSCARCRWRSGRQRSGAMGRGRGAHLCCASRMHGLPSGEAHACRHALGAQLLCRVCNAVNQACVEFHALCIIGAAADSAVTIGTLWVYLKAAVTPHGFRQ